MKRISLIAALCFFVLAACDNSKQVGIRKDKIGAMENLADSMAYSIGMDIGQAYTKQGLELNADALISGLMATMEGAEASISEEEARLLVNTYMAEVRKKQQAAQPQRQQPQTAVRVGQEAPEIALATPSGETLKLSDLRGKYVLVDFWASWCRPCRKENPNVVRMYAKYKDKGFEILGVSLDKTKEAWVQAIATDGLEWKHVSDLKFWQSVAAQTYGVRGIPYTVLVDPEGKVVAQNLRGPSLESKLAELLDV